MDSAADGITPQVTPADLPLLRAAYSDRTAALMANMANLAYDFPPKGAQAGLVESCPAEFVDLGFDRVTWFMDHVTDGWAYVAEGPKIIVVAFRGTASWTDWRTNFKIAMRNPPRTAADLRVHEGFLNAFTRLDSGSSGLHLKLAALTPGIPIYFCGHSLGGALAQIAAAVFASDQVAACYTFGSPRVGNAAFDLSVKVPSYRVMNGSDLVPQIPFLGSLLPWATYRHSGDARYLPEHRLGSSLRYSPGFLTRLSQIAAGLVELVKTHNILGIADHSCRLYATKLATIAEARNQKRAKTEARA